VITPIRFCTILLVFSCGFSSLALAQKQPQQPPARVKVQQLEQGSLAPSSETTGTLFFDRTSDLSSEVAGRIEELDFSTGDRIKAGEEMAVLDQQLVDAHLEQLRAQVGSLQAQLEQVRRDQVRFAELHSKGAASTRTYEELLFRTQSLEKDLQARQAELKQTQIKKNKSRITAPFTALVLNKNLDVGAWVTPGTPIARLGSLSDVYVRVPLHEELYSFNKPGQKVGLRQNATGVETSGVIEGISGQANLQTKNLELRIHMPEPPELLAENMSFTCRIATGPATQLLLVPRDAIITHQGQKLAYTIVDGKATPAPLQIVTFKDSFAGARSPVLQPGMPVVVDGNERLRPEQPVQIIKE